jgi:hypothetical protein
LQERTRRWLPDCYRFATTFGRGRVVKAVHGARSALAEPSPVGSDRELDAGVAEHLLDVDDGRAVLQEQARERVAQAMRREVRRETRGLQGALEGFLDVGPVERRAIE